MHWPIQGQRQSSQSIAAPIYVGQLALCKFVYARGTGQLYPPKVLTMTLPRVSAAAHLLEHVSHNCCRSDGAARARAPHDQRCLHHHLRDKATATTLPRSWANF